MSAPCLLTRLYTYKKSVTPIPDFQEHHIKDCEVTEDGKVFLLKERKSVSLLVILNCSAFSETSIFIGITNANLVKSNIEKIYSDKNSGLLSGVKKLQTIKFCPSHQYIPVFKVTNMSFIVFSTHLLLRVFSFGSSVKKQPNKKNNNNTQTRLKN